MAMLLSVRLRATVLTACLSLGACAPVLAPAADNSAQVLQALHKNVEGLTDRVRVLEDSLPLLACGPEMRALFRDIRKECNAGVPPDGDPEEAKAAHRFDAVSCKAEQLTGAIAGAERDMDTRSIGQKLISLLRHEVVYVSEDGKLTSSREKRLQVLASERRLPSTRFLVVTAPVNTSQEAERRARTVIDSLIRMGIPEFETIKDGSSERRVRRFDNPWVYRITVPSQLLKPGDRPIPPEPRDAQRAVYIFRTDCQ